MSSALGAVLAAPAPGTPAGNALLDVSLGGGLLIIALAAQWLISNRLKHQKVSKAISWIAWTLAIVGGTKAADDIGHAVGIASGAAAIAAWVALLFILCDIVDLRPDWLAFILIVVTPAFMRLAGGGSGRIFDVMLKLPDLVGDQLGAFLGI